MPKNINDRELNSIRADLKNPNTVYLGTDKRLYRSVDGGLSWKEIFSCRGEQKGINDIFIGENETLYIATKSGVFKSTDGKNEWKNVFKGSFSGERDIKSLAMDVKSNTVYVLTRSALYKTKDGGSVWEKIFFSSDFNDEYNLEETNENNSQAFKKIVLDRYGNIYLATDKGLLKSYNEGRSWERISDAGLYSLSIEDCAVSDKYIGNIYVATDKGIFEYTEEREAWQNRYLGLEDVKAKGIAFNSKNEDYIWCLTGNRIYRTAGESPAMVTLYDAFRDEPCVREVQEMAIEYAEVSPEKIKRWRRNASLRAILPKVTFGIDNSVSDTYEIYTNSSRTYSVIGPRDSTDGWDIQFSWELGDLIYNDAQTSIDTRSKLMVQLREDILNNITRLYFERRRLQLELLNKPHDVLGKSIEKEMRLQELTASIDALTNGEFSKAIKAR